MSDGQHRYVRISSLDALSSSAFPPPSSVGRWRVLSHIRPTPRQLVAILSGVTVLLVLSVLHARSGGAPFQLAWTSGRYGTARLYSKMLASTLADAQPKSSWKEQMVDTGQYLTAMMFGGQSNQLLAMINLLHVGKQLSLTVILPPFTAIHFKGQQRPFNLIYDLPRLYEATGVAAIPLGYFKTPNDEALKRDELTCWSTMELYTGAVNNHQVETGFNDHGIFTKFWALPRFPRTPDGAVINFDPLLDFLRNRTRQLEWVEETRRGLLPQKNLPKDVDPSTVDKKENVKPWFDPLSWTPPTKDPQVLCLDAAFYLGYSVPPPPYPQHIPLEPWRGRAWQEVGQHLHFIPEVVEVADDYLARIFGVGKVEDVPPYIAVHIRRGDFKNFHGNTFTPLKNYIASVTDVRRQLQDRLDFPPSEIEREGKPALKQFKLPPSVYEVVVTSDEGDDSEMWDEVRELGWTRIDHTLFNTAERHGEWWLAMIDGEVLSRAQGFVGTQWSTFSMASGLRVEYWQGGVQVVADPK
ncbi:hypothetical protein JCM10207_006626 [Rhodosporidiobolus poonsookiae]